MEPATDKEEESPRSRDIAKFELLLAEGKQAYITNKLKDAEAKLSEAAELSVNIYGYFAIETFDPHFYYGKTLLELARMEDEVFSNALQGITEGREAASKRDDDGKNEGVDDVEQLTEEDRAEIIEKVEEALEENAEALEKKADSCRVDFPKNQEECTKEGEAVEETESEVANKGSVDEALETDKGDAENERTDREETLADAKGNHEGKSKNIEDSDGNAEEKVNKDEDVKEGESKEDKGGAEEEKDEMLVEGEKDETVEDNEGMEESNDAGDVGYLQLAWESLEVARTICDNHLEEEGWKEKKVEVLLDLVDCASDSENYKQAIDDVDVCITLMESIFDEDDRRIAQAYYVKARTHSLAKDFENAAKIFEKSKAVLETKLAKLEADTATGSANEGEKKIKEEIDELRSLLPEIQMKIDDCLESAKSMTKETVSAEESTVTADSAVKEMPVDDVSNLVRKKAKRPAEDKPEKEAKRAKDGGDVENAAFDPAC